MTNDQSQIQLSRAVAQILANADADIASRNPICKNSGKCCQFETYGHRLYITSAELTHFAQIQKMETQKSEIETPQTKNVSLTQFFSTEKQEGCPYQINGLCTARSARPLGCRIYFCDSNAQSWQNDLYEKYHAQLKNLHQQFNLPYRYLEWRTALREIVQGPAA